MITRESFTLIRLTTEQMKPPTLTAKRKYLVHAANVFASETNECTLFCFKRRHREKGGKIIERRKSSKQTDGKV